MEQALIYQVVPRINCFKESIVLIVLIVLIELIVLNELNDEMMKMKMK